MPEIIDARNNLNLRSDAGWLLVELTTQYPFEELIPDPEHIEVEIKINGKEVSLNAFAKAVAESLNKSGEELAAALIRERLSEKGQNLMFEVGRSLQELEEKLLYAAKLPLD